MIKERDMFKRSLTFTGMILLLIAIIFSVIGLSFSDLKKNQKEKEEEMRDPLKSEEVKIIALKEEIPVPIKVLKKEAEKKKEKPPEPKKTDIAPVEKPGKEKNDDKLEPKRIVEKEKVYRGKKLLPAKLQLDRQSIEAGKALIDKRLPVPIVQASYDRLGFGVYLKKMSEMGGDLFVGDVLRGEILARVVTFRSGDGEFYFQGLDEGNMDRALVEMALFRPREISGEKLIRDALIYSEGRFEGDLRCVILLPLEKEAAILGSLEGYLRIGKYDISAFDLVWGNYFYSGNEFGLKLEKGRIYKTGEIIKLDMVLVM